MGLMAEGIFAVAAYVCFNAADVGYDWSRIEKRRDALTEFNNPFDRSTKDNEFSVFTAGFEVSAGLIAPGQFLELIDDFAASSPNAYAIGKVALPRSHRDGGSE